MITVKTYQNTILVSFSESDKLNKESSVELKSQLLSTLRQPYSNIMVDFNEVKDIDKDTIEALIAGQRLSEMNRGQVSLFNVKEQVYKTLKKERVDHLFFFCDLPKPFSQDILIA